MARVVSFMYDPAQPIAGLSCRCELGIPLQIFFKSTPKALLRVAQGCNAKRATLGSELTLASFYTESVIAKTLSRHRELWAITPLG